MPSPQAWPALPSLVVPPTPRLPREAVPPSIEEITTQLGRFLQTPPEAVAVFALAVLSAAARGHFMVQVRPDYSEQVTLYLLLGMESGTRKSEIVRHLAKPIVDFEVQARDQMRTVRQSKMAERKTLERELKRAERQENITEIARLSETIERLVIPAEPRLLIDDCTPEKAAVVLAEQNGVVSVLEPEGGLFGIASGRYAKDGAPNIEVFLRAHSGEALRVDRILRDTVLVPSAKLSIGMAVQPSLLRAFVANETFRGRGLVARFLLANPPSWIGQRLEEPDPIPDGVLERWHRRIDALLTRVSRGDTPGELRLSAEAYACQRAFYQLIESEMGEGRTLEALRDWAAKLPGAVVRIAALLHLAEHAEADPLPVVISEATMRQAVKWGEYFSGSARAVLRPEDPEHRDLRKLVRWLQRRNRLEVSLRDVKRHLTSEAHNWTLALDEAVDLGMLRLVEPDLNGREGGGRLPGPRWEVSPYICSADVSD
jgi:replicative DNA helicase